MKKFLMIALLAMAGITAASDSKTDVGTEITLDEARSLLSGGSSAPGSTVIRLSPIEFKDNKQDIASISISIPGLTWLVDFGTATEIDERFGKGLQDIQHVHIIGDRLTTIKREFLMNCSALLSVRLPDEISTIRSNFLKGCPEGVKKYAAPNSATHATLISLGVNPNFESSTIAMPVAAAAPDRSPIVAIHPPKFVPKLGLTYEQILEIMQDSASPLYSSRQYAEAIISQHFRNTQ
ncbi:MAG: hypothetical protein NTW22_04620 [Proteobacteria bacterium]|nr:hypothetical protein [Pseudomonadota bacterium]